MNGKKCGESRGEMCGETRGIPRGRGPKGKKKGWKDQGVEKSGETGGRVERPGVEKWGEAGGECGETKGKKRVLG